MLRKLSSTHFDIIIPSCLSSSSGYCHPKKIGFCSKRNLSDGHISYFLDRLFSAMCRQNSKKPIMIILSQLLENDFCFSEFLVILQFLLNDFVTFMVYLTILLKL